MKSKHLSHAGKEAMAESLSTTFFYPWVRQVSPGRQSKSHVSIVHLTHLGDLIWPPAPRKQELSPPLHHRRRNWGLQISTQHAKTEQTWICKVGFRGHTSTQATISVLVPPTRPGHASHLCPLKEHWPAPLALSDLKLPSQQESSIEGLNCTISSLSVRTLLGTH